MSSELNPMPTSQAEWDLHNAFYQLTIGQRNRAWQQIDTLTAENEHLQAENARLQRRVEVVDHPLFVLRGRSRAV